MSKEIIFSEKQKFKQGWLWLLLLAIDVLFIYAFIQQVVLHKPFGDKPMPAGGIVIALFITLSLTIFIWSLRLETQIREDGIYVRFFPVHAKFRFYAWGSLQRVYVRSYSPLGEFGGWGIRGGGANRALNVSGTEAIQLETNEGKRLLIGTAKPVAADEALRRLSKSGRDYYAPTEN